MLRSVSNIVIAPAKTGRLTIRSTAVIITDHKNKGKRLRVIEGEGREMRTVVKKLILPRIEEIPAKWRLKIAKSTEIPLWYLESDKGG